MATYIQRGSFSSRYRDLNWCIAAATTDEPDDGDDDETVGESTIRSGKETSGRLHLDEISGDGSIVFSNNCNSRSILYNFNQASGTILQEG